MKIRIRITRTNDTKNLELNTGSTVLDAIKKININPDTVIVISKGTPIPIDDELCDGQELEIIQVSSGG